MEVLFVAGFFAVVVVPVIWARRLNLAIAAVVIATMLMVALILQATALPVLGGYAALGLVLAIVVVGSALELSAWTRGDDDAEPR